MYSAVQLDEHPYHGAREIKPFKLKNWVFHSKSFCCCIPVRFGFVVMTFLSFLFGGLLAGLIWFELSHSYAITNKQHAALVAAGFVETLLFILSIIGFIGGVARKQTFVIIYTYTIYIHFIINLIVGIYFLVEVRQSRRQSVVDLCSQSLSGTSKESECAELLSIPEYVFIAITACVLLLELYGAVIASRYVHRLRGQKKTNRERRIGYYHAMPAPPVPPKHSRTQSDGSDVVELLSRNSGCPESLYDPDVLDIRPQSAYSRRQSIQDTDLDTYNRQASQDTTRSTDSPSSRRIRALPPRPSTSSSAPTSSGPNSLMSSSERVSDNTQTTAPSSFHAPQHSPSPIDEDRQSLYSSEQVSTGVHSAMMHHALFMRPVLELPPPYHDGRQRPGPSRQQKT